MKADALKNHYDVNKKGLTKKSVKPFLLEQSRYPINNPVNRACGSAVEDNRAGDRKNLCADTRMKSYGARYFFDANLNRVSFIPMRQQGEKLNYSHYNRNTKQP